MHNPALVLENDTQKLLWDFDVQTNPRITARKPDLKIINNISSPISRNWMQKYRDAFGTVTKGLLKGLEDLEHGG